MNAYEVCDKLIDLGIASDNEDNSTLTSSVLYMIDAVNALGLKDVDVFECIKNRPHVLYGYGGFITSSDKEEIRYLLLDSEGIKDFPGKSISYSLYKEGFCVKNIKA